MKAENLSLHELVEFSDGFVGLHGRRLILHDMRAFAQFRDDLIRMAGLENARRVLTRFGYFWGEADAAALRRIFAWDTVHEWLRAGARMSSIQGMALTAVTSLEIDPEFRMVVRWHSSIEAEEHLTATGTSDHPVCWVLAGYASGYASYCMDEKIYFIESQCRASGSQACVAEGRTGQGWGDALEPYRSYFEFTDIHNQIQHLTEELRRRAKELERRSVAIDRRENRLDPAYTEVRSRVFAGILDMATRVAPYDTSVMITGESGVGKEVLARYVHAHSSRAKSPMIAVNCAALPDNLLESELFGHRKGAFTGAVRDSIGLFEAADGGTIFLDEIADISPALQNRLLRVLQEGEIRAVGDSQPRTVNVRVLCATNKDIEREVEEKRFREDLMYRLRVIEIEIPPLRERPEDILPLARSFVRRYAKEFGKANLHLDAACIEYLEAYSWPGNVRELQNTIERGAVLAHDETILPADLPAAVRNGAAAAGVTALALGDVERDHILRVLDQVRGNRTEAARLLQIGATTLWRKLKEYGQ